MGLDARLLSGYLLEFHQIDLIKYTMFGFCQECFPPHITITFLNPIGVFSC